ncbi:UNVERIFIED_CONTAM: hypothetical protein K2H54_058613 [Gekko kuhli]
MQCRDPVELLEPVERLAEKLAEKPTDLPAEWWCGTRRTGGLVRLGLLFAVPEVAVLIGGLKSFEMALVLELDGAAYSGALGKGEV